ncbi:MAG TPA: hypothetical protein VJL81_11605 [Solirubrobacterales bacterium]|nr:hypothetical protein [Solirubrobacterales bacterium]
MAALQFWIRGDLAAEQRQSLTEIGARAIPMSATRATPDGDHRGAAWTMIEAPPGEPEAERNRVAAVIGAAPDDVTGPYAPH